MTHRASQFTARAAAATLVIVLLAGCGFHLRGWDLAANVATATVLSADRVDITRDLEAALRQSGVELVAAGEPADVTIEILDESVSRRSASVSGQARVAEYELTSLVAYRISSEDGPLLGRSQARAERSFRLDRDNIVGSSEEQALLEREMRRDLIEQIMRSLNRVTEQATAEGAAAETS
ncbi:MAG: LPS assembly lipoprotein LptE [Pseudomonadaceae bacterium]|nr:LPS assembly lipoprotein LptE [Pseudomonadaceae bacterium]